MGAAPLRLARDLAGALKLTRAVETGTFQGEGAQALATVFPSVVTVELDPALHAQAAARLAGVPNITFLQGDSREVLAGLADASQPTLWFLDGHWSDGPTAGAGAQCPVLTEISAVATGHPWDCIVIDDARLFLASPPAPYRPEDWPPVLAVFDALRAARPGHHITVLNDQVIAVPQEAKVIIDRYGQSWAHRPPVKRLARKVLGSYFSPFSVPRRVLRTARRRASDLLGSR